MQVKASQATSIITHCIRAGLVPMLSGSPGTGKSQIIHQIAEEYNLKVIDLRLSQCDPSDLNGFPQILGGKAGYIPMDTFPIEGDPIPAGYSGWVLLLDEFNSAAPAVAAASYKISLDRMVGMHKLHKNVAIVCAGNLETDNAIVNPMSTALQSRLVHLEMLVDAAEWVTWATKKGIDHRITSFINFKPGMLYTFKADHTDNTYACPRTWEFTDKAMKVLPGGSPDTLPMLSGILSEGVAREFIVFCKIHDSLPKLESILANPEGMAVPTEPSILFALTGAMAHHASGNTVDALLKFVKRIPVEFQVVCIREMNQRNKTLITNTAMQEWLTNSSAKLF